MNPIKKSNRYIILTILTSYLLQLKQRSSARSLHHHLLLKFLHFHCTFDFFLFINRANDFGHVWGFRVLVLACRSRLLGVFWGIWLVDLLPDFIDGAVDDLEEVNGIEALFLIHVTLHYLLDGLVLFKVRQVPEDASKLDEVRHAAIPHVAHLTTEHVHFVLSFQQYLTDAFQGIVLLVGLQKSNFVNWVSLGHARIDQIEHVITVAQAQEYVAKAL